MIGVALSTINQSALDNYLNCGWYFYAYGSSLYSGPPLKYSNRRYGNLSGRTVDNSIIEMEVDTSNGNFSPSAYPRGLISSAYLEPFSPPK